MELQERIDNIQLREDTHSLHIEDSILKGPEFIKRMKEFFNHTISILEGTNSGKLPDPTVKIDGAPAVTMFSSFPGFDEAGVSTKSIFNSNPKVYYSIEDIDEDDRPDGLKKKLKTALKLAQEKIIPSNQIWQGDLLWTKGDAKTYNKDGESFIYVKPNTLVYAAPADSELANRMLNNEIGIVFHTKYSGNSIQSVKQSNDVSISELENIPDWAFVIDAKVPNLTGKVSWNKEESEIIYSLNTQLQNKCAEILSDKDYNDLSNNEEFIQFYVMTLQNNLVDKQKDINPEQFVSDLHYWVTNKMRGKYDGLSGLKTKKGRDNKRGTIATLSKSLHDIIGSNSNLLKNIAEALSIATELKQEIMQKMESASRFITMVEKREGQFQLTGNEGFVVSDVDGNFVKLVDRKSFSYFNRSPDVVKGFEHPELKEQKLREDKEEEQQIKVDNADEPQEQITSFEEINDINQQLLQNINESILRENTLQQFKVTTTAKSAAGIHNAVVKTSKENNWDITGYKVGEAVPGGYLINWTSSTNKETLKKYISIFEIDEKNTKKPIELPAASAKNKKEVKKLTQVTNKNLSSSVKFENQKNNIDTVAEELSNTLGPNFQVGIKNSEPNIIQIYSSEAFPANFLNLLSLSSDKRGTKGFYKNFTVRITGSEIAGKTFGNLKDNSSNEKIINVTPVQEYLTGYVMLKSFEYYTGHKHLENINKNLSDNETIDNFIEKRQSQRSELQKQYTKLKTKKGDEKDIIKNKINDLNSFLSNTVNIPRIILQNDLGLELEVSEKTNYLVYKTATEKTVNWFKTILKVNEASINSINNFFNSGTTEKQTWFYALSKLGLPRFINQLKKIYSNGDINLSDYNLYHPDIHINNEAKLISKRNLYYGDKKQYKIDRDSVCPADIIFVKKSISSKSLELINNFLNSQKTLRNDYINLINNLFRKKEIIPISLKKNSMTELDSLDIKLIINSVDPVFNQDFLTYFELSDDENNTISYKNILSSLLNTPSRKGQTHAITIETTQNGKHTSHLESIDINFSKAGGNINASPSMELNEKPSRGAKLGRFVNSFMEELKDANLTKEWFNILVNDDRMVHVSPDIIKQKKLYQDYFINNPIGANKKLSKKYFLDMLKYRKILDTMGEDYDDFLQDDRIDDLLTLLDEELSLTAAKEDTSLIKQQIANQFRLFEKIFRESNNLSDILKDFADVFINFLANHNLYYTSFFNISDKNKRLAMNFSILFSRAAKYKLKIKNMKNEDIKLADYAKVY